MKTSQRILTDILLEQEGDRLYVLDILQDDHGVFHLWKYHGRKTADNLGKRKVVSAEDYDEVYRTYIKTYLKKVKGKTFRRLIDGEQIVSAALGKILKPASAKPKKPVKPAPKQEEHRKLQL
jgi:hypothetical protein